MKTRLLILFILACYTGAAQLLSSNPAFIRETSTGTEITVDATMGNQGLKDYTSFTDVYVHIGAITSLSTSAADWKYVKFTWATTNPAAQCVYMGSNRWRYTISSDLRTFFGITNPAETIRKISILFRSGNGSRVQRNTDASDMYIPVYDNSLYARVDNPFRQPMFLPQPEPINKNVGDNVTITGRASAASATSTLNIYFNGALVNTGTNVTTVTGNGTIASPGTQRVIAEVIDGAVTNRDTLDFLVAGAVNVLPLPAGVKDGVNYETDATVATFVIYAPNKTRAAIVGDFNNWTPTLVHQMNQTPDGLRWWIKLTGLTPGQEYAYQYIFDNSLKVADYNAEKVLDPWNDQYIPASHYPSLKPYPTGLTSGIVSVFQTNKPQYNWTTTSYVRPDKRNLVTYELLLRDFLAASNWNTLRDSIPYLKRLGINTIELMPVNEFEGNNSWGYNPSFFFAPDKYYGTENAFKQFIDVCHANGIAVVMDIAMNHAFGQSPLVQMYWNSVTNQPASNSAWFNETARHPFNVGYDFNHEAPATRELVARVIRHWLVNYKIDGFRWDLSKGFTQTNSGSDVNFWSNYDAGRVATWKRIYDTMQQVSPGSYCILEHFAANSEEQELANYGMLFWGNSNNSFNQCTMGYNSSSNFEYGIHTNRGWSQPHLMTYQESHDEERLMYKNIQFGNISGGYNTKDTTTALKRMELATAFWAMIPGPKMMWQFGELGFDYSINYCQNGTVNSNCRVDPKPVRWDYLNNPNRRALYNVYAALLKLRNVPAYLNAFTTSNVSWGLGGQFKWMLVNDPSLRIMVVGNFDVVQQTGTVTFPVSGTWYSYLTGSLFTANGGSQSITLQPGEYYVYTDRNASATVLSSNGNPTGYTPPRRDSAGYVFDMKVKVNPNPANAASMVEYSLVRSGNFTLHVLDMNGKRIASLANAFTTRGTYRVPLRSKAATNSLAPGMYLLQAQLNGKQITEKFIVGSK